MKKKRKIFLIILAVLFVSPFILLFGAHYTIQLNAKNKTFSNPEKIPKNKVGLVLGTAPRLRDGRWNLYFLYRIDASVKLFERGKIDFILVSGDNGSKSYDEPNQFKKELIKRGIPPEKIYLDYAGFRTLDSVVRAKEIFGQESITIISQKFHNERAIFIAEKHGIKAIAFNAKAVYGKAASKTNNREYFARVKAFMDILFGVEPKFLGEKIEIK